MLLTRLRMAVPHEAVADAEDGGKRNLEGSQDEEPPADFISLAGRAAHKSLSALLAAHARSRRLFNGGCDRVRL